MKADVIVLERIPDALTKTERRILETALTHYREALGDTAAMMKSMGHYAAHGTCVEEKGHTIRLLDKVAGCARIELSGEE